MASLFKRPSGTWSIQFEDRDGRRRTMSLGRVPKRAAETTHLRVEKLAAALIADTAIDPETARWLASASDKLTTKLSNAGLIRARPRATLGAYLDDYVVRRVADPRIKATTIAAEKPSQTHLRAHFGETMPLRDITKGQASRWRVEISEGRKENTVRKWISNAKKIFNAAIADELIERNPFDGLPCQAVENRDRDYFVTVEEAAKVLGSCPTIDWRLIFGMTRFAGLRCPSEVLGLRWADILWDQNKFIVRSTKTEHHEGHASRFVPLWPEVRQLLDEAFDLAKPGAEYVVTKTRDSADNLRTQMNRIIEHAGVEPWPKVFQNLRATRATEVADQYGEARESKWIGHSRKIARKHYFQVTDDDYAKAAASENSLGAALQKALRNPLHGSVR